MTALIPLLFLAQVLRPPTITPSTPLTPNRVVITDSAGRLTTISGVLTNCVLGNATLSACGGAGGVSDGDKGDIVISGTGTVYSIDTGVIVNSQINASAAIALSKLATVTASRVLVSDSSGNIAASSVTSTTLGYLDATSSIQTQLNGKQASLGYTPANSTTTITAGSGLTGGGDLSANRTITLNINGGVAQTCSGTDKVSAISALGIATCSADQTGGGGVSDGDKGDITVSSSGTVWTIDNSAVTLAKIANIADQRILGNVSGLAAAPSELTAANVKTMLALAFTDISGSVTDAQVPDNITISLAATATALAVNGANCGAGLLPRGVDASGAAEGCAAVSLTADVSGTLPVANGGTGITSLGTGIATWLGTPSSANLASAITDETGSGSLVFATSPTLTTPNLGTPSAVTLTNGTGLPISTGVSGLGTGVATALATPSSANIASAVTDETGSGSLVFGTAPTLTRPTISAYTVSTLPAASSGQLAIVTDAATAGSCSSGSGSALSLCRYNGSAWAAVGDGGSGGGTPSDTVLTPVAFASLPAAGTAGRVQYFTNAPFIARDNGSSWDYWCKDLIVCYPAGNTTFGTAVSGSGSPTLTTASGLQFLTGAASTGTNITGWFKTIPSAPYTITVRFLTGVSPNQYSNCGLGLRDSGSGNIITLVTQWNSGAHWWKIDKFNSATSYNSSYSVSTNPIPSAASGSWLRIVDNNTNRVTSISYDGVNWIQIHSVGRTDFITPNQIGILADSGSSNTTPYCTFESYKES